MGNTVNYKNIFSNIRMLFDSLDHFPTTRLRLFATVGLIVATGFIYLNGVHNCVINECSVSWEPPLNWLIFLSALAGVDVTQYFAKGMIQSRQASTDANEKRDQDEAEKINHDPGEIVDTDDGILETTDVTEVWKLQFTNNETDERKG